MICSLFSCALCVDSDVSKHKMATPFQHYGWAKGLWGLTLPSYLIFILAYANAFSLLISQSHALCQEGRKKIEAISNRKDWCNVTVEMAVSKEEINRCYLNKLILSPESPRVDQRQGLRPQWRIRLFWGPGPHQHVREGVHSPTACKRTDFSIPVGHAAASYQTNAISKAVLPVPHVKALIL